MKHAILLTHGPIGDALVEAVRGIMGLDDGLHALSVTDMSIAEIASRLQAMVTGPDEKQDGVIIMASLRGGSCWNVAVGIASQHSNVRVLSGVNLPMVLSFITKRQDLTLEQLVEEAHHDGLRGICLLSPGKSC
jgi:mannose/fructose/sorbose-specific phosphotransferase system IIA component